MTLNEIERIRKALMAGTATQQDLHSATDEALKFHHKVSELQERLLVIQQKCEMELREMEAGMEITPTHHSLVLDYILDVIEECRHIQAA